MERIRGDLKRLVAAFAREVLKNITNPRLIPALKDELATVELQSVQGALILETVLRIGGDEALRALAARLESPLPQDSEIHLQQLLAQVERLQDQSLNRIIGDFGLEARN